MELFRVALCMILMKARIHSLQVTVCVLIKSDSSLAEVVILV